MSSKTSKLGLTIWNDTDPVNFEEMNANFKKIDGLVNCIESGTVTSTYTAGLNSTIEWYYKKYTDGTIDMSGVLYYTNLKCNGGDTAPYYSVSSTVNFPFTFSNVYDVQMHLVSNTFGWLADITGETISTNVTFRVCNMSIENDEIYKQVFINIKGRLAS